jgi:phage baseplate assembly protein gpV
MTNPSYGSSSEADSWSGNLLRSGTVTDRRLTNAGPQVQVQYPDRGVTSNWIPVGQHGSKGAVFHFCPRVGDNVTVAHFPTGIETGIVIGTNPTPNNPGVKPTHLDAFGILYEDGSYHEYNPQSGCKSINGIATLYLNSQGEMQIISGSNISVTTTGNLTATVGGSLTANVTGAANVTAATATLQAGTISPIRNATVTGSLTVTGTTLLNGGGTATPHLSNTDGVGGGA